MYYNKNTYKQNSKLFYIDILQKNDYVYIERWVGQPIVPDIYDDCV
jgi:hypothetical protein